MKMTINNNYKIVWENFEYLHSTIGYVKGL